MTKHGDIHINDRSCALISQLSASRLSASPSLKVHYSEPQLVTLPTGAVPLLYEKSTLLETGIVVERYRFSKQQRDRKRGLGNSINARGNQ
jgi:hypothetical protein